MSSRLPVELYKIIVDNLEGRDNRTTLHACSLTCKAFLHASRSILFHDLHLRNESHVERFGNLPVKVSSYVRRLFLGCLRLDYEISWKRKALPVIATSIQNTTTLGLDSLRWGMLDDTARSTLLSGFPCVKELNMICLFETSAQMNELLASFPSLTKLTCDQSYWLTYLVPMVPLPPSITSIKLSSSHAKFFDHLLSLESHFIVSTIEFGFMGVDDLEDVGRLLEKLGSHVEYLDLGPLLIVHHKNPQCHVEENINLSHNTNLRSIQLIWAISERYTSDIPYILLSQIASPHLEQVVLETFLGFAVRLAVLDNVDWLRIDDYFSQRRWANLHNLVFILLGRPGEVTPATRDLIMGRLPLLEGRVAVEIL